MRNKELIVAHMSFAASIANKWSRSLGREMSDLESEAIYGLVRGGMRCDTARMGFKAYVSYAIIGQMKHFLRTRAQQPFCELFLPDAFDETLPEQHTYAPELCDFDTPNEATERSELRRIVAGLPARWRRLLVLRFWFGFTQKEAGAQLGIGVDRVGQIQRQAFERIREALHV